MNCRGVQDLLPLYISGEVSDKAARRLGLHLEVCTPCREEFETYCRLRRQLRELREVPMDGALDGFSDKVEVRSRPLPLRRRPARRLAPAVLRWTSIAAASVLVGLVAVQTFFRPGGDAPRAADRPATRPSADAVGNFRVEEARPYVWHSTAPETTAPVRTAGASVMRILAGPKLLVPVESPADAPPIPRVQPYAWAIQHPKVIPSVHHNY